MYVSKERCLKIASRAGIPESEARSLITLRDETSLKGYLSYTKQNKFFFPFLCYCFSLIQDEMQSLDPLSKIMLKLKEELAQANKN